MRTTGTNAALLCWWLLSWETSSELRPEKNNRRPWTPSARDWKSISNFCFIFLLRILYLLRLWFLASKQLFCPPRKWMASKQRAYYSIKLNQTASTEWRALKFLSVCVLTFVLGMLSRQTFTETQTATEFQTTWSPVLGRVVIVCCSTACRWVCKRKLCIYWPYSVLHWAWYSEYSGKFRTQMWISCFLITSATCCGCCSWIMYINQSWTNDTHTHTRKKSQTAVRQVFPITEKASVNHPWCDTRVSAT